MNFLETASQDKKSFALDEGKHVVQIQGAEIKTTKAGHEYVSLTLGFEDGQKYFHNLFFHSEGAIKMCAPQLKKLMLIEKLPIYKTAQDLMTDIQNFVRKVEAALNVLNRKKIELTVENYFSKKNNEDAQSVRISGYLDLPNELVQTAPKDVAPDIKFNAKEEFNF